MFPVYGALCLSLGENGVVWLFPTVFMVIFVPLTLAPFLGGRACNKLGMA